MPLYPTLFATQPPSSVTRSGDTVTIVNAEQLGVGNYSQRAAVGDSIGDATRPITLTFTYNDAVTGTLAAPGAVEYDIFVAWVDSLPPTLWTNIGKTTNVAGDQVTIQRGAAGGQQFKFVLVQEVTTPTNDAASNKVNATVVVNM